MNKPLQFLLKNILNIERLEVQVIKDYFWGDC